MNYEKLCLLLLLCFVMNVAFSQSSIENHVKEGVAHHDNGEYDLALKAYKKALKLDKDSPLANYEIALTYFMMQDYQKSIMHSDVVLREKGELMMPTLMNKASALDAMGKSKAALKVYRKALEIDDSHYLLHYNLGLCYYNMGDMKAAENAVVNAIGLQPQHSSSHMMLAFIHNQLENPVRALMASHFFLFLEPASARSSQVYAILQSSMNGNVSTGDDGNITISMSSFDEEDPFSTLRVTLPMLSASNKLEENKDKSKTELFVKNTLLFFDILDDMYKTTEEDIWSTHYIPFFNELSESEHLQSYCMYILHGNNEEAKAWIDENQEKLKAFGNWLSK